jgi:hypothetical protein
METKGHNLEANMVSLEEKFVEDVNEKQPRDVVEMDADAVRTKKILLKLDIRYIFPLPRFAHGKIDNNGYHKESCLS